MKRKTVIIAVILVFALSLTCFADSTFAPYNSYLYDEKSEAVEIPHSYLPTGYLTGDDWHVGAMNAPEDMMVADDGRVFISDTGNNRVVIVEADLSAATALTEFTYNGEILTLNGPLGIYATADTLYICDTGNRRVLVSDLQGQVSLVVTKPTSEEFEQELEFEPRKVATDKAGNLYVLCKNVYQGAVVFTAAGEFDGFFGSNTVQSTLEIVVQKMFKNFMTKEQRSKMAKYVPAEYENLTVRDNFIYTVSYETNTGSINLNTAIRKLNPAGNSITDTDTQFGDLDMYYDKTLNGTVYTRFADLAVDEQMYVYALDSTYGKVFIYDAQYNLLCAFSGTGEQTGLFRYPVAIGKTDTHILVLDRGKNSVTTFAPTAFFGKVQQANSLFEKGLYDEALTPWQEVLAECSNYNLAYVGIGKALFQQGDYAGAMACFETIGDQENYSEAFKYYRLNLIRENFTWLMVGVFGLVALLVLWSVWLRRPVKAAAGRLVARIPQRARTYMRYPGYCMRHPFEAFEEMKDKGHASYVLSAVIVAVWVLSQLLYQWLVAFIFNANATGKTDVNMVFITTVVVYVLWVAANLGLRTFMAGRGTLREICAASAYSLLPYTLTTVLNIGLSYFLTQDEGMFMSWVTMIGLLWSGVMLVAGIKGIHEYTFGETVKAILLTLLFVVLIVFLFVLFYSSLQQAFSLVGTIFSELRYRYF
ncbi:MAG: YIP1 family protein [Clostridia bacterium]|nr:YIP1 family protein [Clostridia bacterium]